MYTFARFPDLGAFSHIIQSHPKFENVPSGLVRDRDGNVLGHALDPIGTRRFGTFRGAEGDTLARPPPGPIMPGLSESKGSAMDLSIMEDFTPLAPALRGEFGFELEEKKGKTVAVRVEDEIKEIMETEQLSLMDDIIDSLASAGRRKKEATKKPSKRTFTRAETRSKLTKAVRKGIKKSQEDDPKTARVATEEEVIGMGLPKSLAKRAGKLAAGKIRKHSEMELKETAGIVAEVEAKEPSRRGRPTGSRGLVSPPVFEGFTNRELQQRLSAMGHKSPSTLKNKAMLINEFGNISKTSGVPVERLLRSSTGSSAFSKARRTVATSRMGRRKTATRRRDAPVSVKASAPRDGY